MLKTFKKKRKKKSVQNELKYIYINIFYNKKHSL